MENKLNYFNFLYATDNGFVGFESKLNKKEKKTLKAKLIWKRETKDSFAIEFAEWLGKGMTCRLNNGNWIYNMELKASTTEELLERYKEEKGLLNKAL